MNKKKAIALMLGAAMLVGSLTGCGGKESEEPKKTADGETVLEF